VLAEAQGFEPWIPFGMPVFKTGAIDHSAKLPEGAHFTVNAPESKIGSWNEQGLISR
jgi:hypothetical protein